MDIGILDNVFLNNSVGTWVTGLSATLMLFLALNVLTRNTIKRLKKAALKTKNEIDDLILDLLGKTNSLIVLVLSVYVGTQLINLPPSADRLVGAATVLVLLLQGLIWGNELITYILQKYNDRMAEKDPHSVSTIGLLGLVARCLLWAGIILLALDNLGIDITAMVAGLGIGGLAIALAAQNILTDLFSSLSIFLDKPFQVGDFIIVGDHLGTVEKIGIKTTRIKSLTGEQIIISNTELLGARIRNFKRMEERRIIFILGVTYQTPHEKLAAIPDMIKKIVDTQDGARIDRVHFKEYGASSLDFEIVYYVMSPEYNVYMDIHHKVNLAIYKQFEDEKIEFAYPTQTLFLEKNDAQS